MFITNIYKCHVKGWQETQSQIKQFKTEKHIESLNLFAERIPETLCVPDKASQVCVGFPEGSKCGLN